MRPNPIILCALCLSSCRVQEVKKQDVVDALRGSVERDDVCGFVIYNGRDHYIRGDVTLVGATVSVCWDEEDGEAWYHAKVTDWEYKELVLVHKVGLYVIDVLTGCCLPLLKHAPLRFEGRIS